MKLTRNRAISQASSGGRIAVFGGAEDGAPQVTAFVSALDENEIPTIAAILNMSPEEARDLAARLIEAASEAEGLKDNKEPWTKKPQV